MPFVIADHADRDRRAVLLGADHDAFHRAFLLRGHLPAERRRGLGASARSGHEFGAELKTPNTKLSAAISNENSCSHCSLSRGEFANAQTA